MIKADSEIKYDKSIQLIKSSNQNKPIAVKLKVKKLTLRKYNQMKYIY